MNRLAQLNKRVFLCFVLDNFKKAKYFPLAPIGVKILFVFSLKTKRLQRIAGPMPAEKAKSFCSKNN